MTQHEAIEAIRAATLIRTDAGWHRHVTTRAAYRLTDGRVLYVLWDNGSLSEWWVRQRFDARTWRLLAKAQW